jgi:hypothetical protein
MRCHEFINIYLVGLIHEYIKTLSHVFFFTLTLEEKNMLICYYPPLARSILSHVPLKTIQCIFILKVQTKSHDVFSSIWVSNMTHWITILPTGILLSVSNLLEPWCSIHAYLWIAATLFSLWFIPILMPPISFAVLDFELKKYLPQFVVTNAAQN